ncbi:MAG: uracil-DNA glycosylase [Betaproteobacteria bacterium]|uniref:Type-4 uracil-DNA glycosylase n=1 Tax=Candidatus Proximibacter danicus TaxID=2954365 RepID=A0A9D7PQI9_9PROT|nr:uracil-DNA glycosylase [Candidatus Proximibacter danicus]
MNLTRSQLLHEMGLGPVWRLRDTPIAAAVAGNELAATLAESPAAVPVAAPVAPAALARRMAAVDAEAIAGLGWPQLREAISTCGNCGLCQGRKQAVPGVGDEQADWLFIGEGPGAEEDARGEPFVGPAGKLLDAMLAAIDLKRGENVYIANAVKCRPPENRTPEADEMAACWPWLKRQIVLLRPKLIVLLGRAAMHAVLHDDHALGTSRGKRFEYRDGELVVPVVVTYHPAYLLRNLPDKAKAWEDLCFARNTMREQQAAGMDLPLEAR